MYFFRISGKIESLLIINILWVNLFASYGICNRTISEYPAYVYKHNCVPTFTERIAFVSFFNDFLVCQSLVAIFQVDDSAVFEAVFLK